MSREFKAVLGGFLALAIVLFLIIKGLVSGRMPSGRVSYDRKTEPLNFFAWLSIYVLGAIYMIWMIVRLASM